SPLLPPPPRPPPFPYTTLFRSRECGTRNPSGHHTRPDTITKRGGVTPGRGPLPAVFELTVPGFLPDGDHDLAELLVRFQVAVPRSEEHTSELQSRRDLVCRLLL